MDSKQLLAIASRRGWMEVSTLMLKPENHPFAAEMMQHLETLADKAMADESWSDAGSAYQAAVLCGTILAQQDPKSMDALFRLGNKFNAVLQQSGEQQARDQNGPLDWSASTERAIKLARLERRAEALAMLRRLDELDDPEGKGSARCGARLEEEAGKLPPKNKALRKWFLEQAVSRFKKSPSPADVKRLQATLAPPTPKPAPRPPPPKVDFDALVAQLAKLALRPRSGWMKLLNEPQNNAYCLPIAGHFEALADACREKREWRKASTFYGVASAASYVAKRDASPLHEKMMQLIFEEVDDRIARPIETSVVPDNWDDGWDQVESLALAGRFFDADELLLKLESVHDDDQERGFRLPARFETIGDYLLPEHPQLARWFYQQFRYAASCLPADCAYEGAERAALAQVALGKIAAADARLPRWIATIETALSAVGQGPRPEPEVDVVTVENGKLLKLVPHRELYTRRQAHNGKGTEPIPPENLHRYYFCIHIEGQELRLLIEQCEYGRVQSFGFEPTPPISANGRDMLLRMQIGKPVLVYYNVPGGGPAWTLTLKDITTA